MKISFAANHGVESAGSQWKQLELRHIVCGQLGMACRSDGWSWNMEVASVMVFEVVGTYCHLMMHYACGDPRRQFQHKPETFDGKIAERTEQQRRPIDGDQSPHRNFESGC